jgi:hypothetical protein
LLAVRTAQEDFNEPLESETIPEPQKPVEGHTGTNTGVPRLQREAESRKAEAERTLKIYQEYQQNIKTSSQIQTEILKGIKAGESVYSLFLKAAKSISLMTSNSLFYSQIEADIAAIYGKGLLEPEPLKMELEAVEGRLAKLRTTRKAMCLFPLLVVAHAWVAVGMLRVKA